MNKQKIKSISMAMIGILLLVIIDQVTKFWAVFALNPANGGSDIVLLDGVFRLHYLENRGAAFGLLQGKKVILVIATILIFLFVTWLYTRIPNERRFRYLQWIATAILAGAIGNLIDRIRLDYVIDFFYFELINFPVFNIADIYVTCSAVILVILFIFYYKEEDLDRILPGKKKKEVS